MTSLSPPSSGSDRAASSIRAAIQVALRDAAKAYEEPGQQAVADALMTAYTELRNALVKLESGASGARALPGTRTLTFAQEQNAIQAATYSRERSSNGHHKAYA